METTVAALNRKAWGLFGWAAALAAAWMGVNLLAPDLAAGRLPVWLGLVLATDAFLLYGLWRGLARTDLSPTTRVTAWLAVALGLTAWIAATWTLAASGVFRQSLGKVPTLPIAIFLPLLVGGVVLTRSRAVGALLDATPASWLVGVQVYRILGGMIVVNWIHGAVPGAFGLPAGIGDVITGLLALPAAVWVASGSSIGRRIGIRWNVLGLADFAVAVTMGMLTSPGPAHLLARDHPNTLIATFPTAMVPAFIVPLSTLLHVLSLRQLKRGQRTSATDRHGPVLPRALTVAGPIAN